MTDRVPTYPGRVRLVPVSGSDDLYDLIPADEPIEDGTPLNKATLLADSTATRIGIGDLDNPTVNDAMAALAQKFVYKSVQVPDADSWEDISVHTEKRPQFLAVWTTEYESQTRLVYRTGFVVIPRGVDNGFIQDSDFAVTTYGMSSNYVSWGISQLGDGYDLTLHSQQPWYEYVSIFVITE